jgi:2,4-dienoyl-CoA reductase-like NADH-dependent reductase (Old Yellow Enzyme family)
VDDYEGGSSLADSIELARALRSVGVDVIDCSSGGIFDSATGAARRMPRTPRVPGFQVPYAQAIRRETGLATMAVGLILDPGQAQAILEQGQADLVAIGREALYDPNWPLHAARELGADEPFERWPKQYGWWLVRREQILAKQGFDRRHFPLPVHPEAPEA